MSHVRYGGQLVGRSHERALLADFIAAVARSEPGVLVVHGEAGIGKTVLVREQVRAASGQGFATMWGTCVHFASSQVPHAPLVAAVHDWLDAAGADSAHRLRAGLLLDVLTGVEEGDEPATTAAAMRGFDHLVRSIATTAPTLVVVDDLHWADASSRDAIAYLVSGLRTERLGLVLLVRSDDRREGHPLHEWLADLRRYDAVHELVVGRMSQDETAEQMDAIVSEVSWNVAAAVHRRTAGNPYFTELLARSMEPGARELPERAPAMLRDALLSRWHALPGDARYVARVLAVGGRPQSLASLGSVVSRLAPAVDTSRAVHDGVEGAVLVRPGSGRVWFRHPLLADVLGDETAEVNDGRVHAAYAAVLVADDDGDPATAVDIAEHLAASGEDSAYKWALVAADRAAAARAYPEQWRALETACQLGTGRSRPGHDGPAERLDLLRRTAAAARACGEPENAVQHLDEAIDLVDPDEQPLVASALAFQRSEPVFYMEPNIQALDPDMLRALKLAEADTSSVEYVMALAEIAANRSLDRHPEPTDTLDDGMSVAGRTAALAALEIATRTGNRRARAWALYAVGVVDVSLGRAERIELFAESYALALDEGDLDCLQSAGTYWVTQLGNLGRYAEQIAVAERLGEELAAHGELEGARWTAALGAASLLMLGQWERSESLLRPALVAGRRSQAAVFTTWVAALLAVRRGDVPRARRHLARLSEIASLNNPIWPLDQPYAELSLAIHRPDDALETLKARHDASQWRDYYEDDGYIHIALAAAATADLAEIARDRQDRPGLERAAATLVQMRGWQADLLAAAPKMVDANRDGIWRARYVAESRRFDASPDEAQAWVELRDRAVDLGFPWEQAYAGWRLSQALVRAHAPRAEVAAALRPAAEVSRRLGAVLLTVEMEDLGRASRINLAAVDAESVAVEDEGADDLLTAREREVLAHLVAGRTNGEIATALYISAKTVSVHVSSILRKTGTQSRVEAAGWARRRATS